MQTPQITPHLFRTEYSKIVAVLYKSFRFAQLEIAEDLAADTFLKASESWSVHGLPENPKAWLYTVAKNKARDYLRHRAVVEAGTHGQQRQEDKEDPSFEFTEQIITDSLLATLFSVCDPLNSPPSQICLALQILCGFSLEEIASALLIPIETVKKRLQRARANLRESDFQISSLTATQIENRLPAVLKTIYLLFNEGYYSATHDQVIRKDLCSEALRLALMLTQNSRTKTPATHALLALLYFQSSRLEARLDENGQAIRLSDQDPRQWDVALIQQGNEQLIQACTGSKLSTYHLEAAIAYWHTTPAGQNKWPHILKLYDQLLELDPSPIVALNRVFAYTQVHGHVKGLEEAVKLPLENNPYYHGLLGYLLSELDNQKAIAHYQRARELSKSPLEITTLTREIEQLLEKASSLP